MDLVVRVVVGVRAVHPDTKPCHSLDLVLDEVEAVDDV